MAVEFTMPQLGLTMTEGTVSKWLKKVGDPIVPGDLLVEVSTDKITNEIETTASGTLLKILVAEGGTAPVKAPLALIGNAGENVEIPVRDSDENADENAMEPGNPTDSGLPRDTDGWIKASPLARKLARQRGIDLAVVKGTGPDQRVLERDVLAFAASPAPVPKASPLAKKIAAEHGIDLAALDQGRRITKADVLASLPQSEVTGDLASSASPGSPLSSMRKVIAERMSLSWQTAPHVHLTMETDMSEAVRLKQRLSAILKVSFTDIIVKCAAQSLTEFPMVNNRLRDGQVVENAAINIGIAVGLDNGLIVPVIKNADRKSLRELSAERIALAAKARDNKLLPDDYAGGTFTITNLGMYGVDHFTPIINPPESTILAVCRVVERPVVVDGTVAVRPIMNLCLAFDHRLIDGVLAARFMSRLRQYVEQPMLLL
jgi:pyruvate dehydrogenase E2 component (dihydrolipoamide acetyltransferase)